MFKKLLQVFLFTALIALLVLGGINRTLAKTGESGLLGALREANPQTTGIGRSGNTSLTGILETTDGSINYGRGRNSNNTRVNETTLGATNQGRGWQSDSSGLTSISNPNSGFGQGNKFAGLEMTSTTPEISAGGFRCGQPERSSLLADPQANVDEWTTIDGSVIQISSDNLVVLNNDGTETVIEGRAWSFAQAMGFNAASDYTLRLTGFYEDLIYQGGTIENLTSGQNVSLRDTSGRPLWSGQGRRGS
jgi:uncharacterized protein YdeI (BOF family)